MGSISALDKVLMDFWGGFTDTTHTPPLKIPAYAGFALERNKKNEPVPATPPFITYDFTRPAFGGQAFMQASIWDRNAAMPNFRGLTNLIAEQVEARIPESGLILNADDNGKLWILRSDNFMQYMSISDPDDNLIVRCMFNLLMKSYIY